MTTLPGSGRCGATGGCVLQAQRLWQLLDRCADDLQIEEHCVEHGFVGCEGGHAVPGCVQHSGAGNAACRAGCQASSGDMT